MSTKRLPGLFRLTDDQIKRNLTALLCDDSSSRSAALVLSSPSFQPESFTVSDRMCNKPFLTEMPEGFECWCRELILDQLARMVDCGEVHIDRLDEAARVIQCNLFRLLEYRYESQELMENIWNQEFIDVLRRIIVFSLSGDPCTVTQTHKRFNELAASLMPTVTKDIRSREFALDELLRLSILSGLSGLDLKGSGAAASSFGQPGIAMKKYLNLPVNEAAAEYLADLINQMDCPVPIFDWDMFMMEISAKQQQVRVVWFLDDFIEAYMDLLFLERLFTLCTNLSVTLIPRNGVHGNDMSYSDMLEILAGPLFPDLKRYLRDQRLSVCAFGPSMGALNLRKLSLETCHLVAESDLVVVKGCRAHEMVQGGLNKPTYTAYVVCREYSESVSGYDARTSAVLFFRLDPGEYAFYGFRKRHLRMETFGDRLPIMLCTSTLRDHERRKHLHDPIELVAELKRLQEELQGESNAPGLREADMVAEGLLELTTRTYDQSAQDYRSLRGKEPHERDKAAWKELLTLSRQRIGGATSAGPCIKLQVLDIGTGSGRDIAYASRFPDVEVIGIDNSDGFMRVLEKLEKEGAIPHGSYRKADMRDLSVFPDESFDIVRHNATLVHMPVIGPGYAADRAISESYRVLRPYGVLFVNVKEGISVDIVDTQEGLGGRFYQFYNESLLRAVLERNGFEVHKLERCPSSRNPQVIWLSVLATKQYPAGSSR